ncbi:MAG: hypothetical protein MR598_03075 [Erysipelotrichaceae bacterium]|nr:hypothetical protein [Erysipelotrichaceae bacterium]
MKKENLKSIIIIGILVTFSLGSTYAFLNFKASNNTATGVGGCFQVNYSGQAINNLSLESSSTYTEGASSDIILSKSSDCDIYTEADIYLYTNTTTTAPISNGALKYKVVNGSTTIGEGAITSTGDKKLATVTLSTTSTTYKVYLWIDPDISNGTFNDTTYSGYIYANAVQTSTIKGT